MPRDAFLTALETSHLRGLLPEDELERLEALRRYHILYTPPDRAFDHIAEVAAGLFRVPIAMVCLVDRDRFWFKSHHGIEAQQGAGGRVVRR